VRLPDCTRTIVLAALCLVTCAVAALAALAAPSDPVLDPDERAVLQQINSLRAKSKLAPLKLSAPLTKAAKWMSADMAANDYFDHTDSTGRGFSRRIAAFGFAGATKGENIAAGTDGSAAAIFGQWKGSAGHRKNMLYAGFTEIGIGRAYDADSLLGWYWTTTFGGGVRPGAASRPAPRPSPAAPSRPQTGSEDGGRRGRD
jgi:uncharacterized protein YkwD